MQDIQIHLRFNHITCNVCFFHVRTCICNWSVMYSLQLIHVYIICYTITVSLHNNHSMFLLICNFTFLSVFFSSFFSCQTWPISKAKQHCIMHFTCTPVADLRGVRGRGGGVSTPHTPWVSTPSLGTSTSPGPC